MASTACPESLSEGLGGGRSSAAEHTPLRSHCLVPKLYKRSGEPQRPSVSFSSVPHLPLLISSPCPQPTPDRWLRGADVTAFNGDRLDPEACVCTVLSHRDSEAVCPSAPPPIPVVHLFHLYVVHVLRPGLCFTHCKNSVGQHLLQAQPAHTQIALLWFPELGIGASPTEAAMVTLGHCRERMGLGV